MGNKFNYRNIVKSFQLIPGEVRGGVNCTELYKQYSRVGNSFRLEKIRRKQQNYLKIQINTVWFESFYVLYCRASFKI